MRGVAGLGALRTAAQRRSHSAFLNGEEITYACMLTCGRLVITPAAVNSVFSHTCRAPRSPAPPLAGRSVSMHPPTPTPPCLKHRRGGGLDHDLPTARDTAGKPCGRRAAQGGPEAGGGGEGRARCLKRHRAVWSRLECILCRFPPSCLREALSARALEDKLPFLCSLHCRGTTSACPPMWRLRQHSKRWTNCTPP